VKVVHSERERLNTRDRDTLVPFVALFFHLIFSRRYTNDDRRVCANNNRAFCVAQDPVRGE